MEFTFDFLFAAFFFSRMFFQNTGKCLSFFVNLLVLYIYTTPKSLKFAFAFLCAFFSLFSSGFSFETEKPPKKKQNWMWKISRETTMQIFNDHHGALQKKRTNTHTYIYARSRYPPDKAAVQQVGN